MGDDSMGQVPEGHGSREYFFSGDMEGRERMWRVEQSSGKLLVALPSPVRFAYCVKEGSLVFADELHQNGRLAVGDVPHVIPPVQTKSNRVYPEPCQAFTTARRGHVRSLRLILQTVT